MAHHLAEVLPDAGSRSLILSSAVPAKRCTSVPFTASYILPIIRSYTAIASSTVW